VERNQVVNMTIRTALACAGCAVVSLYLVGCGDSSTDVTKSKNDAYHSREAGSPPPPGAMTPKGPAVGPFANSGGVPPGTSASDAGATKGPPPAPGK